MPDKETQRVAHKRQQTTNTGYVSFNRLFADSCESKAANLPRPFGFLAYAEVSLGTYGVCTSVNGCVQSTWKTTVSAVHTNVRMYLSCTPPPPTVTRSNSLTIPSGQVEEGRKIGDRFFPFRLVAREEKIPILYPKKAQTNRYRTLDRPNGSRG